MAEDDTAAARDTASCPRCGLDLTVKQDTAVSEEDKKSYIRAILGDKPFQKEFSFFDGALRITFQEMPGKTASKLFRIINDMPADSQLMMIAVRVKMGLCTAMLSKGGVDTQGWVDGEVTKEAAEAVYDKVYGNLPESTLAAAHGAFAAFNKISGAIGTACLDKNF